MRKPEGQEKTQTEQGRLTDVTNNARQLDVDDQVPRIKKLGHLVLREAIHTGHLNVDIFISDSQRLPDLRCGKAVEEVEHPPRPSPAFTLDWTQSGVSRRTSMHTEAHSNSHSDPTIDVCSPNAAQDVRRPCLH
jgi:hypothetical protein